jgi:hypothetical protein
VGRSFSVQLALASLLSLTVGNILWLFLVAVDVLVRAEPLPVSTPSMVYFSLMVSVAFFSMPLIWWGNKVGCYVAMAFAVVSLLANASTVVSALHGLVVPENFLVTAVGLVFSLVLLASTAKASREKA